MFKEKLWCFARYIVKHTSTNINNVLLAGVIPGGAGRQLIIIKRIINNTSEYYKRVEDAKVKPLMTLIMTEIQ